MVRADRGADDVGEDVADRVLLGPLAVEAHPADAGAAGGGGERRGDIAVDHHVVEEVAADVGLDGVEVLAHREAEGLARLAGHVADVDLDRGAGPERLDHAVHQQVGEDRGVERTGADDHHLGVEDGGLRLRVDRRRGGLEEDPVDPAVPDRDLGLPDPELLSRGGAENDIGERAGDDGAPDGEDAPRLPDGVLEVAGDLGHGHDEEVPKGVAAQLAVAAEAVLEELGHQRLGLGQGGQALPEVPRR